MRPFRRVAVLVVVAVGCGGGGTSGPPATSVEVDTLLSAGEVEAGGTVEVTCVVRDTAGDKEVAAVTAVTVSPEEGILVQDHVLVTVRAGQYQVACRVPDLDIADSTPATLVVRPGAATRVEARVDPDTVQAGAEATVTCVALDAHGNEVPDAATSVDPVEGLHVSGDRVWASGVGQYAVTCSVAGGEGVEKVPDILVVTPGDPARVDLVVTPDWKAYAIGDEVTLGYKVFDAFENEVAGIGATFRAPEPPAVEPLATDRFRFGEEGLHEFSVTLVPPWDAVTASRTLLCDESPPVITILFPDRGQTFTDDPKVVVQGTVTDTAGVKSLSINGAAVEVGEDGHFEYSLMSRHGLNGIVVLASDTLGHAAKVTRGYYYSTKYLPVADEAAMVDLVIPEAAMVFAGQEALDDGDHDPAHLDDLATIVEVLLGGLDIPGMLGGMGPFQFDLPGVVNVTLPIPGVDPALLGDLEIGVQVTDVTLGSPRLALKSRDGGLDTSISFSPLSVGLKLTLTLRTHLKVHNPLDGKDYEIPMLAPSTSTTSRLTIGTLQVKMALDIEKLPGQPLSVQGRGFDVTLSDIQMDPLTGLVIDLGTVDIFGFQVALGTYDLSSLVGGLNDLIANYVLDPLVNFITQPLIDLLEPLVTGLIGDAVEQVLALLAIEQTIEIPPLLGGQPIPLDLKVDLSSVRFRADGARLGLDLGVRTKKGVDRDPLGSILRDGCLRMDPDPPLFEFPPEPSLQAGVRYDFANEGLFMVWWTGLLSGPLDLSGLLGDLGSLPISNVEVTPDLLLPPILDDCNESGTTHLQVGDAYLDLKFQLLNADQHIGIWLQADISAQVVASGDEIGIRLDKVEYLEYEMYDIGGNMGDLMGMVEGLLPALLDQVAGQEFRFPVPPVDVGGLIPGLPQGAMIQLGNLSSSSAHGVLTIGGDFQ